MKYKRVSDRIREQMQADGKRYWAGDNISSYVTDEDKDQLIDEATEAFEQVLDTLLIDRATDPNSQGTIFDFSPDQRMFVNWINYCNKNSNNPHLPRFSGFESFEFQGRRYIQARMEALRELPGEVGNLVGNIEEAVRKLRKNNYDTAFNTLINYAQHSSYEDEDPYYYEIENTMELLGGAEAAKNLLKTVKTVQQFAEMEPLCPYKLSFSFSDNLPAFMQQITGITPKLTARSMDRADATNQVIDVIATVVEQPTMNITDYFELQVVDPCISTKLSNATIPELVAF